MSFDVPDSDVPDSQLPNSPGRVDLQLKIRVSTGHHDEFMRFLRAARPLYEAPGDIRIRLLRSKSDPERYIEVVEYRNGAFEADQRRVDTDPEMIATLAKWRSLLAKAPHVEIWDDITAELDD